MAQDEIPALIEKAEEFGAIAMRVNESSTERRDLATGIVMKIDEALAIGETLNGMLSRVAEANKEQRTQDYVVLSACTMLRMNAEMQREILASIKAIGGMGDEVHGAFESKISHLLAVVTEAAELIEKIVNYDNSILILDNHLMMLKKNQQREIGMLKQLGTLIREDAEQAIEGSASNLKRGLTMVEKIRGIDALISGKKTGDIARLADEARSGRETAESVNRRSSSQLEFAEKVMDYNRHFYEDSNVILELVQHKHHLFEENIQLITVLTVVISIKLKKYLEIEELFDRVGMDPENRKFVNNLRILVDIANGDIRGIANLNYDMTDQSHVNNETENKAMELTKEQMAIFDEVRETVNRMTEVTRYPILGSSRNIEIGRYLEEALARLSGS